MSYIRVCFFIILVFSSVSAETAIASDRTVFWSNGNWEGLSHSDILRPSESALGLKTGPMLVTVSGRVVTTNGRPINRARVYLLDENGVFLTAYSSPFGYYRIENVVAGAEYPSHGAFHKQYFFITPAVILVFKENTTVDFRGQTDF